MALAEIAWDYDEETNVFYLSVGTLRSAVGVDISEGVVARYDETHKEAVGITLVGLRARLLNELEQDGCMDKRGDNDGKL